MELREGLWVSPLEQSDQMWLWLYWGLVGGLVDLCPGAWPSWSNPSRQRHASAAAAPHRITAPGPGPQLFPFLSAEMICTRWSLINQPQLGKAVVGWQKHTRHRKLLPPTPRSTPPGQRSLNLPISMGIQLSHIGPPRCWRGRAVFTL